MQLEGREQGWKNQWFLNVKNVVFFGFLWFLWVFRFLYKKLK